MLVAVTQVDRTAKKSLAHAGLFLRQGGGIVNFIKYLIFF